MERCGKCGKIRLDPKRGLPTIIGMPCQCDKVGVIIKHKFCPTCGKKI